MTPEQEQVLIENVAVTRSKVEAIEKNMVTHDECEARRIADQKALSNGALTTYRDRTWRIVVLVIALVGSGVISWLLSR